MDKIKELFNKVKFWIWDWATDNYFLVTIIVCFLVGWLAHFLYAWIF